MSILKKLGRSIEKGIKKVVTNPLLSAAVGTAFPSVAPILKATSSARQVAALGGNGSRSEHLYPNTASMVDTQVTAAPGRGFQGSNVSILPAVVGGARAVVPRVAGAIRRYGGTAATVGAAGAMLYDAAGNPVATRRRPRSKGITARELKSFTRVTAILNKYCKTPPPMKRRAAGRSKSCR